MRNDEKIDIQIGEPIPDDLPAVAKAKRLYATAHRYIEISKYMKKYEDRDKYLHRGIRYMKKCYPTLDVHAELRSLRLILFRQRAEGRIELYQEAQNILDHANSELDYSAAYDLFQRIHKHELTHSIPENLVDPDLYAKWMECTDSEQKMEYCEQQKEAYIARNKNKSRITSIVVLGILVFALIFSRTNAFIRLSGDVLTFTGNYDLANQQYSKLYKITGDETLVEKQCIAHYKAAMAAAEDGDYKTALSKLVYCSQHDYSDSKEQVLKFEKLQLANANIGNEVSFGGDGGMKWYVLAKDGNQVLLFKKYALDLKSLTPGMTELPAFDSAGGSTWETSSLREWLNGEYLEYKFSDIEQQAIVNSEVEAEDNVIYRTSAGNDTVDKIFILSASEYQKYAHLFNKTENPWWTRTPGNAEGSMTFVDRFKNIMYYGYDVRSQNITVKPVIAVDYSE